MDVVPDNRSSSRRRRDDIKRTIWLTRPDLRALCEDDLECFEWWLLLNGAPEYGALAEAGRSVPHDLLAEPAAEALSEVRPTFTRFMRLTWTARPDLRRRFDVATVEGQQSFVWWYFTQGPAELGSTCFITEEQRRFLNAPDERLPVGIPIPITRLMMQVWSGRPDLKEAFSLDTPEGRGAFGVWYYTHGLAETRLADLVDGVQAQTLLSPIPGAPDLPRILTMIWSHDADLRARFSRPLDPEFGAWAWGEGTAEYPILKRLKELAAPAPAGAATVDGPANLTEPGNRPAGYNLIGEARPTRAHPVGSSAKNTVSVIDLRYFCLYSDVRDNFIATGELRAEEHYLIHGAQEGRTAPTEIEPAAPLVAGDQAKGFFLKGEIVTQAVIRSDAELLVRIISWGLMVNSGEVTGCVTCLGVPVLTRTQIQTLASKDGSIVFCIAEACLPAHVEEAMLGFQLHEDGGDVELATTEPICPIGNVVLQQAANSSAVNLLGWMLSKDLGDSRVYLHVAGGRERLHVTALAPDNGSDGLWPDPRIYPVAWWTSRINLEAFPPGELLIATSVLNEKSGAVWFSDEVKVIVPRPFQFPNFSATVQTRVTVRTQFAILAESWCDGDCWAAALQDESCLGVFHSLAALQRSLGTCRTPANLIVLVPQSSQPPRPAALQCLIRDFTDPDAQYDLGVPHADNGNASGEDGTCLLIRWEALESILVPAKYGQDRLAAGQFLREWLNSADLKVLAAPTPLVIHVEDVVVGRSPKEWLCVKGWISSESADAPEPALLGPAGPLPFIVDWVPRPDVWNSHAGHVRSSSQGFSISLAWSDLPVGVPELTLRIRSGVRSGDVSIGIVKVPAILCHLEETFRVGDGERPNIVVRGWAIAHDGSSIQTTATDGDIGRPLELSWYSRPDVAAHAGLLDIEKTGFMGTFASSDMDLTCTVLRLWSTAGYCDVSVITEQNTPLDVDALVDPPEWLAGQLRVVLTGRVAALRQDIRWVELQTAGVVLARETATLPVPNVRRPHVDMPLGQYCGFRLQADLSAYAGWSVPLRVSARIGETDNILQEIQLEVPYQPDGARQAITAALDSPQDGEGIPEDRPIVLTGWAVSLKQHPLRIEAYIGVALVGADEPRLKRRDVAEALALPSTSEVCGYKVVLPRKLAPGEEITLQVVCRDLVLDQVLELGTRRVFGTAVNAMTDERLQRWYAANAINRRSMEDAAALMPTWHWQPKVSILMPHFRAKPEWLDRALESVEAQWYRNFELCVADDGSGDPAYEENLKRLATFYPWLKVTFCAKNGGIAAATNACAELATGDFVLLFDQDDELARNCLYEFVKRLNVDSSLDIIYSDSDKIDTFGRHFDLTVKPEFDPDMLLSYMYMNQALLIRRSLFEAVGRFRNEFDGSQDHDLALRLVEHTSRIAHIPAVLYHWRVHPGSTALSGMEKPKSFDSSIRAISDALERRELSYDDVVRPEWAIEAGVGIYRVNWAVRQSPLVSIIVPSRNQGKLLRTCIESIKRTSTYSSYEIVIVDDRSDEPDALEYLSETEHTVVRILDTGQGFNFSALVNAGVTASQGQFLVLLNNDIEVVTPSWIEEMLGWAQCPSVGVVGCRLLFPGGNFVQHAGLAMKLQDGVPGHLFRGEPAYSGGYQSWAKIARGVSAVTFAAAMISRQVFDELGGLDAEHFPVAYQDPNFCLRARAAGYRVVYTPHAELIHHESLSKPRVFKDAADRLRFQLRWPDPDPMFNANLVGLGELPAPIDRRVLLTSPSARVRVAALVHNLKLQGAPISQCITLRGLAQRHGFDVHLLLLGEGPLLDVYQGFASSVTRLKAGSTSDLHEQSVHWLSEIDADVVYANTLEVTWFVMAALEAGHSPFWSIRESALPDQFFNGHEQRIQETRRCLAESGRLGFVAQTTMSLFRSSGMKLAPVTVIPNGVDLGAFAPVGGKTPRHTGLAGYNLPADAVIIGTVGTICPRKAPHLAVRAFIELQRSLPDRPVWFVLVGEVGVTEYRYAELLRSAIAEAPKPERILLLPQDQNIADWYRSFDIFVTASLEESFPRVVIEAMAYGLPVVTAGVFGATEQVINGYTGFTTAPGDVVEMAEALSRLVVDVELRRTFGARARAAAERLYGLEAMVDAYALELRLLREELG